MFKPEQIKDLLTTTLCHLPAQCVGNFVDIKKHGSDHHYLFAKKRLLIGSGRFPDWINFSFTYKLKPEMMCGSPYKVVNYVQKIIQVATKLTVRAVERTKRRPWQRLMLMKGNWLRSTVRCTPQGETILFVDSSYRFETDEELAKKKKEFERARQP